MEVSYLSAGKQLPSTNKLIPLTPFYDDSGIIRVGGRLKNSILADSQKHPILLPKTDHVVNLIISDYHLKLLHAENRPKFAEQIMGDLPESRVCPSSVFQRTGIDFAGPFLIRSSKGRGSRNTKCYICVFVCLATKAVHLEVVSDLTSKAFIACLKDSWLAEQSDDPCVLTPGHFLIGKALTAIPQPTVPDDLRHCDRWRLLTRMTQHFWNRWSSEYLTLLQSRSKWRIVQKNLDIGDLVLIKHDNSPPLQWKLGKVTETFPGKDGKVRVVKVKTQTSELVRPIAKLCPLPINT
ncbi:uncharacterized protein TNCV_2899521 [Trichonephila clavipes]|nr:uncharacterized protein TNCV_2899521 [Trichonephila clavipes]